MNTNPEPPAPDPDERVAVTLTRGQFHVICASLSITAMITDDEGLRGEVLDAATEIIAAIDPAWAAAHPIADYRR